MSNVGLPYVPAPEDGQELLVYPNPVTDVMWVAGMTTLQGTWTLMDTQGQMVRSGAATPWFKVSVEGLPEGLYVLQTTGTDGDVRTRPHRQTTLSLGWVSSPHGLVWASGTASCVCHPWRIGVRTDAVDS